MAMKEHLNDDFTFELSALRSYNFLLGMLIRIRESLQQKENVCKLFQTFGFMLSTRKIFFSQKKMRKKWLRISVHAYG
jgi:hypothetical protein